MADDKHLVSFIKKIAAQEKFTTFDVNISPVSSGGANYTSKLYRVKIIEKERDELALFAKVAIISEKMRDNALMKPYDNEQFFYTNLIKTYRHLEEKYEVAEEHMLKCPKYYGSDMTYLKEIMVLEDLTSKGFESVNRFEPVDWQFAAAAITELAKFHALSIAYQHEYPCKFNKMISKFPSGFFPEDEETNTIFTNFVSSAVAVVREENKERLDKFFKGKNISEMYNKMFVSLKINVLIHVDFRPNNILRKVRKDGITEVIPVDYQTIQGGSPIVDLFYFIFTATDGKFRTKYYEKLLNHYYLELGISLARFRLDAEDKFSRKDFEFEIREKLPLGLLAAVLLLPIITVPENQAPVLDNLDISNLNVEATSDLYSQRLNDVVDDYVQWGVL